MNVLIRNALLIDGTGASGTNSDILFAPQSEGGLIRDIAPANSIPITADCTVLNVASQVVGPGFIDIQSHSILPLMRDGRSLSKVTQGITTEIMGEAWTPAPFGGKISFPLQNTIFPLAVPEWEKRMFSWNRFSDWLTAYVDDGVSVNVGSYLGGGTLRNYVMGMSGNAPNSRETREMEHLAAKCIEEGAFGVAYALIYPPDCYSTTDELVSVCRSVASAGGHYITHVRSESDRLVEAIEEAIYIAREADSALEIYHLKATGRRNWPKISRVVEMIESARNSGVDVSANIYPYEASGTGLKAIFPQWASEGGEFYNNLRRADIRRRIREELLLEAESGRLPVRAEEIMPIGLFSPQLFHFNGRTLDEIATSLKLDWVDAAIELLAEEQQPISSVYFSISPESMRMLAKIPWISFATDAGGFDPKWAAELGPYHPRAYGSFSKVLGRFVRDERLITLEDAIRKMTSLPAKRLGLRRRGILSVGNAADIVVFNPDKIIDNATYSHPHQLSDGIVHVFVNGDQVVNEGQHTGALPGQVVTKGC
ncbi:MAG: amidohydrolase family protein [bacterium]|nr:amidohydrolase family protein [bacterium]